MTSYNTGNPLGSKDPRDLYDNAENLDTAVNDVENDTWKDRFGRSRKTMSGMERQFDADQASRDNRFNTFIASSGYQFLGDYAADIEITEYNQIVRDDDGEFWRLSGQVELPYTTTGAGLPEDDSLTPLGDAVLRQELANPAMGAAMVGRGVVAVDSIADLLALPEGQRKSDLRYLVKGYYAGSDVGGGEFYWDASADKSTADGGKVVDPDTLAGFDGTPSSRDGFLSAQGGGSGSGCYVLISTPNQMNYGCVGDGSFDDSDAVQKAIDARVTFIEKEHAITKSLYVYDSIDMSEATFLCDNKPITYLTLGEESSTFRYKTVGMPKLQNVYSTSGYAMDGVNPDSVGARLISIYESSINFPPKRAAVAFGTGVELFSSGPGVSYSEFNNLSTSDCLKHLSFRAVGNGWITECLFLKLKTSNYSNFSPDGMDLTGLGYNYIHVDNTGPANTIVENITFVSPALEGARVSDHIDVVNGTAGGWVMVSPRFEVPGGAFKTRGDVRGATAINPSHWEKVEGFIGSDKYNSFGKGMVGVGNMPIILGSDNGDMTRMGIGLLNDNRDFSTSLPDPEMVSGPFNDSLVWHINRNGIYAHGYTDEYREVNRFTLNFNQQYIRWALASFETADGRKYNEILSDYGGPFDGYVIGYLTITADVFRPYETGVVNLGSGQRRWDNIYAVNGTINTSDERSKQDIEPLSEAEKIVAQKLKGLVRSFRFKDAVVNKGDNARIHVGVIAQDVAQAFTDEGLDPHKYGLFCYDEWEETEEVLDENGEVVTPYSEAGDRFGIRYDELLAFIISAL